MLSQDHKAWARKKLAGNWMAAIAVCLIADLMSFGVNITELIPQKGDMAWLPLAASLLFAMLIGGVTSLGVAHYFTNVAANRDAQIKNLFAYFKHLGKATWMSMVMSCYIFLWSLLFIIPGIIATYRYAMVPYLIAEFPDLSVSEAMEESSRLMRGNKMRLFCLQFSFIGWILLAMFATFGIGMLWVTPYMHAADAVFYLEITGRTGLLHHQEP